VPRGETGTCRPKGRPYAKLRELSTRAANCGGGLVPSSMKKVALGPFSGGSSVVISRVVGLALFRGRPRHFRFRSHRPFFPIAGVYNLIPPRTSVLIWTLVSFLVLALTLSRLQASQPSPITNPEPSCLTLSNYVRTLDDWTARVQKLRASGPAAGRLLQELPDNWQVQAQGQQFIVTTMPLRDALEQVRREPSSAAKTSEGILARLRMMRDAAASMMGGAATNGPHARSQLEKILSRREFRSSPEQTSSDAKNVRLFRWIGNLIAFLWKAMSHHAVVTGTVIWTVLIGLALAFGAWLVRMLLYRSLEPLMALEAPAEGTRTWQDLVGEAFVEASRGNYREAFRLAYWAGIYRLEKLGIWQFDRTRTHREYLHLLPVSHPQYVKFSALTRRFELTWYGCRPASAEDFREALSVLENLECPFH